MISCPFCNEKDFDLIGLKSHLLNSDCDIFNKTEALNRITSQQRITPLIKDLGSLEFSDSLDD